MTPMWTLEESLDVVRSLQPVVKPLGYHVVIGGGVVNKGYSEKDLDLYFLPLDDNTRDGKAVVKHLNSIWGDWFPLGFTPESVNYPPCPTYVGGRFSYTPNNKRIDVFIA